MCLVSVFFFCFFVCGGGICDGSASRQSMLWEWFDSRMFLGKTMLRLRLVFMLKLISRCRKGLGFMCLDSRFEFHYVCLWNLKWFSILRRTRGVFDGSTCSWMFLFLWLLQIQFYRVFLKSIDAFVVAETNSTMLRQTFILCAFVVLLQWQQWSVASAAFAPPKGYR